MEDKENKFRHRYGFYHRSGAEYLSEPDLTTADKKVWNSGFPPGFTVDELRYYRRKRAPGKPKDHLGLEEGHFDKIKTEYKRRYKNYHLASSYEKLNYDSKDISPVRASKPDDTFKLEGSFVIRPEYHESFSEIPIEQIPTRRRKRSAFQLIDDVNMALYDENLKSSNPYLTSENQSQFIKYESQERTMPLRRSTNLKLEGDLLSTTEKAEQFIEYLLTHRRDLIRNPTNLKMEGDMENKTEMREQFQALDFQARPPLCKKFTNLHLEGDLDTSTENTQQFIQYDMEKRPPLMKRSTNLKLEGDMEMKPEYRHAFVEYKSERAIPNMPQHNLKIDGFFDSATENKSKFVGYDIHPPIPFLRSDYNNKFLLGDDKPVKYPEYKEKFIQHNIEKALPLRRSSQLKPEGEFQAVSESRRQFIERPSVRMEKQKVHSNLLLEGPIDMNPEYKNSYGDFYKGGNVTSPGRRRRTYSQSSNLKSEGAMEIYPEYKRSFVDFPRQRPTLRKPENHLSSEGEMDHVTEKRAQYVEHPQYHKMDSLKRESELKLDGEFECQPEYRKAYIDYLIRERVDRKPRPLDNLGNQKRAFEILAGNKKESSDSGAPKSDTTPSSAPKSILSAPKSLIPVSIKKLPVSTTTTDTETDQIPVSSTSSTMPRPKSRVSIQSGRRKSIGKLESQAFGAKIEIPKSSSSSKPSSRSPSPLPPKSSRTRSLGRYSRQSSPTKATHTDRTGSRFVNAVRVEDLAYTPCTTPISTRKLYPSSSSRKKWNKEDSSAFFILQDDNNNNCEDYYNKSLHKEQKWMPSWYNN